MCRTSPVCFTPSMRLWTPQSTILPAAVRLCVSSCPWPLIAASGGEVVPKVQQVKLALTLWVEVKRRVGGGGVFGGPSCVACCQLNQRHVCVPAERQQLRPVRALFPSLHLFCSMGFIFNDGRSDRAKSGPPSLKRLQTLWKKPLRDVPSSFDNHSHFSFFFSKVVFFPALLFQNCRRKKTSTFISTSLPDNLINKHSVGNITKKYIYSCVFGSHCFGYKYPSRDSNRALKILPVAFMLISNCIRSHSLNNFFLQCFFISFHAV